MIKPCCESSNNTLKIQFVMIYDTAFVIVLIKAIVWNILFKSNTQNPKNFSPLTSVREILCCEDEFTLQVC